MKTAKCSLDSTFAIAVLVTGLVFGILPATASVNAERPEAAQQAQMTLTSAGTMKLTVTAAHERS